MSKDFKYENEEKKIFKILITCKNDKEISIYFTGQSETKWNIFFKLSNRLFKRIRKNKEF